MPTVGSRSVEEPLRRRVRVMSVVPERGYAQCQDATGGNINVSTEASFGPLTFLPKEGQEWYIERVSGVWHFERRTMFQNEGVSRSRTSQAGDVIIEAEGRILIYDKDGKLPGTAEVIDLINENAPNPDIDEILLGTPVITTASDKLTVDDLGNPAVDVTLKWSVPSSAASFEMWWSDTSSALNLGGHSLSGTGTIKDLPPGTNLTFRVRATSASGYMSALSDPYTFTTQGFSDDAPVPSLPKVSAGSGIIEVTWDGKDMENAAMPKNVSGVNISIQDTQSRTAAVGSTNANTIFGYSNVVGGKTYYVRLQSRTFRGAVSEWTAPIAVTAISSVDVQDLHDEINNRVSDVAELVDYNRESLSNLQTTAARLQAVADLAEIDYNRANESLPNLQPNGEFSDALNSGWTVINDNGLNIFQTVAGGDEYYAKLVPPAEFVGVALDAQGGQVWDLDFSYQTDKALTGTWVGGPIIQYQTADGVWHNTPDPVIPLSPGKWATGRNRKTLPAGAVKVRVRAYASSGTWIIDKVVFRNVTELVELERAAYEARQAALLAQQAASRPSPSVEFPLEVIRSTKEPFSLETDRYRRGDVWIDTDSQAPAFEWDDGIWASVNDIELRPSLEYLTTGRPEDLRIYAWDYQPSGANVGDLWIDVGQADRLHAWDGGKWDVVQDADTRPLDAALLPLTSKLPVEQSGLFRAFYQSTQPSAPLINDVWVNGSDVRIYRNSGWTPDANLAFFSSTDVAPGGSADGIVRLFVQRVTPGDVGAKDTGDIWLNGSTAKKWGGTAWVDATVPASTWLTALNPYTANRPVGSISIQYTKTPPATGDYWLNTDTKELSSRADGTWEKSADTELTKAVIRAGARQSIADNQVVIYAQESQPSSPSGVGDFWIDTYNGNKMLVWDGAQWGTTGNVQLSRQTSSIAAVLRHMRGTVSTDIEATMRYVARSAGGNSTIYTASTPPNVAGKEVGDLWWQVSTSGDGETRIDSIVGQWVWAGPSAGWVKQELRHEVISSVDVGSLVVGGQARIADAVIQKLYAEVVESKVIATKLLAVADFTNLHPDPYFENYAEEYELDAFWAKGADGRSMTVTVPDGVRRGGRIKANTWTRVVPGESYFLGGTVTQTGTGITYLDYETRAPDGTINVPRLGFTNSTTVSRKYGEEITIPSDGSVLWIRFSLYYLGTSTNPDEGFTATWTTPTIRLMNAGELVVDGSITTRHLAAEAITSDKLAVRSILADHLDFVSTDPETGGSMSLDATGITLQRDGSTVFQITNRSVEAVSLTNADGEQVVSLDNEGGVSGRQGTFDDLTVDGIDLKDYLRALPLGVIARSRRTSNPTNTQYSKTNDHEQPVMRLEFDYRAGYTYRMSATGLNVHIPVNDMATRARFMLRLRTNTDTGGVADLNTWLVSHSTTGYRSAGDSSSSTTSVEFLWSPGTSGTASVLLSYKRLGGPAGTEGVRIAPSTYNPIELTVWEESLVPASGKSDFLGSITPPSSGTTDPGDTTPAPRRVTQTWTASTTQSWRNSRTYTSNSPGYQGSHMWQGVWSGDPDGVKKSHAVFGSPGSRGNTLSQARSKMTTVEKLEVYICNGFFHNYGGGTARLHYHGSSSVSSYPSTTFIGDYKFKRGEGRWINITSSAAKAAFMSGNFTGIALESRGSYSHEYYGYFRGHGAGTRAPKIRATYLTT